MLKCAPERLGEGERKGLSSAPGAYLLCNHELSGVHFLLLVD